VAVLDPFRLAALSPVVTITGSLVLALALLKGAALVHDAGHQRETDIIAIPRPVEQRVPDRILSLHQPTPSLAEAVADEWRGVEETVDPRAMPLTGLANARPAARLARHRR
jgi:chaperone required for assembly of F1-ATPase